MVSISRPNSVAQEAGVKYFFLGALSAAIMLFGFSYLFGATGTIYLHGGTDASGVFLSGVDSAIGAARGNLTPWQMLAVVMLILGFTFKMVAFPLHVYAADVYQGAATPVTALLSFVPKAAGFAALLKVLYAAGGSSWSLPPQIGELLWWISVLTMTCGNVLGLLQQNVKRTLAYSSIAHSGYMLAAVAALVTAGQTATQYQVLALSGILFYLLAYGLTNVGAFGVLSLLPGRTNEPGSSAETFDEIAGTGLRHVGLGLAMSVSCFSLIGIPLTAGFMGKVLLIRPALQAGLSGLVVILVINSAISAAYYLRIVATMFLRPQVIPPGTATPLAERHDWPVPVLGAIAASLLAVLLLGFPMANSAINRSISAAGMEIPPVAGKSLSAFVSVGR
jgi:NADH-quinone oxidoreductase subunit N